MFLSAAARTLGAALGVILGNSWKHMDSSTLNILAMNLSILWDMKRLMPCLTLYDMSFHGSQSVLKSQLSQKSANAMTYCNTFRSM